MDAERKRMENAGHPENGWREASPWYEWGPYLAERAWGGVREDYSAGGDAWSSFPHDHARSRAYRWNEDGMAGMTDVFNRLSLALSLWNGRDPILKERMFGLAGPEGNHGEDVKEYWWYLDAVPSSAWLRWRYHYPQAAFPYEDLVETNRARSKFEPEYELIDTGIFDDDRYWIVEVHYAKASADRHPDADHGAQPGPGGRHAPRPADAVVPQRVVLEPRAGQARAAGGPRRPVDPGEPPRAGRLRARHRPRSGRDAADRCSSARTRRTARGSTAFRRPRRTRRTASTTMSIGGAPTVNPDGVGTKASPWYRLDVRPGETAELRLRLRKLPKVARPRVANDAEPGAAAAATAEGGKGGNGKAAAEDVAPIDPLGPSFESTMKRRESEADDFYEALRREGGTDDEQRIMRQAFAGMLWSKQYYGYNVARWLDGDPGSATASAGAEARPERGLAALRGRRHPVDARSLGVPVVRGVGPRLPRGHARPHRPGLREIPAAADVPRMVPAPGRGAACLRVVVRRRQPAGPRRGRLPRLRDRRTPRLPVPARGSSTSC